ncbi:MAG: hypothetical protein JF599_07225 [Verrucomicrobia bacterium]|nr:hypothetical protein [Verrucomicrobiota bacterium]
MNPPPPSSADEPVPPGWTALPPEHLPPPTFWPAGFALAITCLFWGLITSWVVFGIGVLLFTASLAGWITDIRHEGRKPHP